LSDHSSQISIFSNDKFVGDMTWANVVVDCYWFLVVHDFIDVIMSDVQYNRRDVTAEALTCTGLESRL
jgi:hypothetical protein